MGHTASALDVHTPNHYQILHRLKKVLILVNAKKKLPQDEDKLAACQTQ